MITDIKKFRQEKQLTQFGLAQIVGVRQATVARWENEKLTLEPKASHIAKLMKFYEGGQDA